MEKELILCYYNDDDSVFEPLAAGCSIPTKQEGTYRGLLWGEGSLGLIHTSTNRERLDMYLVASVKKRDIQSKDGYVEFDTGLILFKGKLHEAAAYMQAEAPHRIVAGAINAKSQGEVHTGDEGAAVVGGFGKAIAGERGVAVVAHWGGRAIAGTCGVAATAGCFGRAEVGEGGVAVANQSAGYAIAGKGGIALGGRHGYVKAEEGGTIALQGVGFRWFMARVGENGIKADTCYALDLEDNFVEVKEPR